MKIDAATVDDIPQLCALLTGRINGAEISFYRRHGFDESMMQPMRLMLENMAATSLPPASHD